ncbi:hypothetical protein [Achromobacter marplatensis]|uniref:hypothetical protein n=1 Tax=Achromobacter marplatensis TaxID=470868 RepID=UPI003C790E18
MVTFSLSISRTDGTTPEYDIALLVGVIHPNGTSVLSLNFGESIASVQASVPAQSSSSNETLTTLTLPQLSYRVADRATLSLDFVGVVGLTAYTYGPIQLSGYIEYQSTPTNGYSYSTAVTFPEVLVRNAELNLDLLATSLERTEGNVLVLREVADLEVRIDQIVGPGGNLTLSVEMNDTYLNIIDAEVVEIGYVALGICCVHISKQCLHFYAGMTFSC